MSVLPITEFPEPILKRPMKPVERIDAHVERLVDGLIKTMRHHPRCVGLAAPQVGSDARVAVMDASVHPKATHSRGLIVLINPVLEILGQAVVSREGCLSVLDFTANVQRATRVSVRAMDISGAVHEYHLEGFEAIVAQHGIDHLDGKLFLDRVVNVKTDVFRRKRYWLPDGSSERRDAG